MPARQIPNLVHWKRDARNGMTPSSYTYYRAVEAENWLTAYGGREVYHQAWPLDDQTYGYSGTTNIARFRFRSRYGATRLRAHVIMGLDITRGDATDPQVAIDVTESGGGTETIGPFYYGASVAGATDGPDQWRYSSTYVAITPATTYECLVKLVDYARLLSIAVEEEAEETVDQSTDYYNALSPATGTPIYDVTRSRLLVGLSNMYRQNGGGLVHWSNPGGTASTRTSATLINLYDNSTTGTPATTAPGFYLDNTYRRTVSRSVVPYELAVYGSMASGSGTVRITDSSGTDHITATINSSTPGWFVATGSLPADERFYTFRFAGDGTNQVSVSAVSLIEWEA